MKEKDPKGDQDIDITALFRRLTEKGTKELAEIKASPYKLWVSENSVTLENIETKEKSLEIEMNLTVPDEYSIEDLQELALIFKDEDFKTAIVSREHSKEQAAAEYTSSYGGVATIGGSDEDKPKNQFSPGEILIGVTAIAGAAYLSALASEAGKATWGKIKEGNKKISEFIKRKKKKDKIIYNIPINENTSIKIDLDSSNKTAGMEEAEGFLFQGIKFSLKE